VAQGKGSNRRPKNYIMRNTVFRIWGVPGLNRDPENDYPDSGIYGFPQSFRQMLA
jgi:hypothetical protein